MNADAIEIARESGAAEQPLPFDLKTTLLGILARWKTLVWSIAVALVLGAVSGVFLGTRVYRTETVLLYRRAAEAATEIGDSTFLTTTMNMVKIPSNLEEIRSRLGLASSIQGLGAAIDARVERKTGLLIIRATWPTAQGSADVANTARQVFLEHHVRVMGEEELRLLDEQLEDKGDRLRAVQVQLSQLSGLELEVRNRIQQDRSARPEIEGLGDVNIRMERLRDAIFDDTNRRANMAELQKRELDYQRARGLWEQGLLSRSEFDKAKQDFEKQKAYALDTDQTAGWRKDLDRLQEVAIPAESATSPSAPVLQEMLLRDFHLRLEEIELQEAIRQLEVRRTSVEEAMAAKGIESSDGTNASWEAQNLNYFRVVSVARAPIYPEETNRKVIAIGVFCALAALSVTAVILSELLDTRVKSEADAAAKLKIPSLGGLSRGEFAVSDERGMGSETVVRAFRSVAARVRRMVPDKGARLLTTSAADDIVRARATIALAIALARQDESVLIVDCVGAEALDRPTGHRDANRSTSRVRRVVESVVDVVRRLLWLDGSTKATVGVTSMLLGEHVADGLGSFLSGRVSDVDAVVHRTNHPGIDVIPMAGPVIEPDRFASEAMGTLLEQASTRYSVVLIDAPPLLAGPDGELLARWADQCLVLVQAGLVPAGYLSNALERLESAGTRLIGAVVTEIDPKYQRVQWKV